MGKQNNTPLILGFVNNAARNLNVSQKQVQNKNIQQKAVKQQKPQQQSWTVVNKKNNSKGTQSFQSWADVASRNSKNELQKQSGWTNVVKQQNKNQKTLGTKQQQPKQQPKQQQQKAKMQQQQPKQQPKQQQQKKLVSKAQQTESWGWYPASKQEAEMKKLSQQSNKKQMVNKKQMSNKKMNNKMNNKMNVNQKAAMNKQNREAMELKKNQSLLKNIGHLYDAYNLNLPSENGRNAWICSNKVGADKVLSVATLFSIKNAPSSRGKKAFVERNGQVIFNNRCIRRAVEGRHAGHNKFRGTRVLTYIPEKWLSQDNSYSRGNFEKYSQINGPKRAERCFSFKGVY